MEIKASQVKELRDMTGVAMMDCKKALVECDGDIEKALDLLRSNSALKAEKKSSRVAADGILSTVIAENYATIIEINSETDFAAKDANFLSFVDDLNYVHPKAGGLIFFSLNFCSDYRKFRQKNIRPPPLGCT